jgi:hypothetical protein
MPSLRKSDVQHDLMWRVLDYLTANPNEVLTRSDIAAKFDAQPAAIDTLLAPALAGRLLIREAGGSDGTVWRAPKRKSAFPHPLTDSISKAARVARANIRRARKVDISAIVIESGVPLQEKAQPGGEWEAVFSRMKAGDSFKVPSFATGAVGHAKLKYCRKHTGTRFAIRKVDDTHARVWRIA